MKKLLTLGILAVFALSLLAPSAFAFGDCAKGQTSTKVADTTKSDKGSS